MTLLTENNGWAIVWMNDRYYIRHLLCGAYLRQLPNLGCMCRKLSRKSDNQGMPMATSVIDDLILKKFKLLTKGDV